MKRALMLLVGCALLLAQHAGAQLDRSKIPLRDCSRGIVP